jgi:hypothetical protein
MIQTTNSMSASRRQQWRAQQKRKHDYREKNRREDLNAAPHVYTMHANAPCLNKTGGSRSFRPPIPELN